LPSAAAQAARARVPATRRRCWRRPSAAGVRGQLGIISTGSGCYVTLGGTAYRLAASDFQKVVSSFPTTGSGGGAPAKLGINPLHWVINPRSPGSESFGGASTTHIRANINISI
jgi:hypothetical protein